MQLWEVDKKAKIKHFFRPYLCSVKNETKRTLHCLCHYKVVAGLAHQIVLTSLIQIEQKPTQCSFYLVKTEALAERRSISQR